MVSALFKKKDSRISAEAFACLSSLTLLEELHVNGTDITDEGLRTVDSLPLVKTLWLNECYNISDQAVEALSISKMHR